MNPISSAIRSNVKNPGRALLRQEVQIVKALNSKIKTLRKILEHTHKLPS
jgi:hypothetical protein